MEGDCGILWSCCVSLFKCVIWFLICCEGILEFVFGILWKVRIEGLVVDMVLVNGLIWWIFGGRMNCWVIVVVELLFLF